MHDHPKLYDKEGNEVTGRPEEGVTYYDADGNELKAPPAGHGHHGGPHGMGVLTAVPMAHLPNCTIRTAMKSAVLPRKASPIMMLMATNSAPQRKSNIRENFTW